jgi:hypothetical protein
MALSERERETIDVLRRCGVPPRIVWRVAQMCVVFAQLRAEDREDDAVRAQA